MELTVYELNGVCFISNNLFKRGLSSLMNKNKNPKSLARHEYLNQTSPSYVIGRLCFHVCVTWYIINVQIRGVRCCLCYKTVDFKKYAFVSIVHTENSIKPKKLN